MALRSTSWHWHSRSEHVHEGVEEGGEGGAIENLGVADDCKDDLTQGGIHGDEALEETVQASGGAVVRIETSG